MTDLNEAREILEKALAHRDGQGARGQAERDAVVTGTGWIKITRGSGGELREQRVDPVMVTEGTLKRRRGTW